MISIKVLTALMRDHDLKEGAKIIWDETNPEQVGKAQEMFQKYLTDG